MSPMQAALWSVFYTAPRVQASGGEMGLTEVAGTIAAAGVVAAFVVFLMTRD